MIGSLYAGASGVKSYSHDLTITGSNIANVNTVGFKYNRTNFEDLMATTVADDTKIGKGVHIGSVQNIQTQGSFETTELETDLAIDGNGFFVVKDEAGRAFYTRAGQYTYNKEGDLTTQDGKYLQVKDVNPETGRTFGNMKKINILNQIDPPTPTGSGQVEGTGVNVIANLDSNTKPPKMDVDYENVVPEMYNYSSTMTVFDAKGQEHQINVVFRKVPDSPPKVNAETGQPIPGTEVKDSWQWMALAPGEDLQDGTPGAMKAVGGGFYNFGPDGRLVTEEIGVLQQEPPAEAGGAPGPMEMARATKELGTPTQLGFTFAGFDGPQQIGFNFGKGSNPDDPADARSGVDGITQFASEYKIIESVADGIKAGKLENIYIREDGTIEGSFDSGNVKTLGRITTADFKAAAKLTQLGSNLFKESVGSGKAIEKDPTENGAGRIQSKALERSNVQLSQEFVKMIEGQRAFQANAKSVTTSDEVIADMVQMKR